jgi:hypothetical protein
MFLGEGQFTRTNRRFVVGGRNGYNAIDEYTEQGCMRMVDSFKTKKQAEMTAGHLNSAYHDGMRDALIGLVLPLYREVEHTQYRPTTVKTIIPAGTMIGIIAKKSAAFFTCVVMATGFEFEAQYTDLRPPVPA